MNKLIVLICAFSLWMSTVAYAAIQTFSAMGEYTMSDYETPQVAEQRAISYARQRAAEQAGVYVASYTKTENLQVTEDDVKSIASTSLEITEQRTYKEALPNGDVHIKAEIVAKVDTTHLDRMLKTQNEEREQQRRSMIEGYKALEAAKGELEQRNIELKRKIAEAKANKQDFSSLKEESRAQEREFLSNEKAERSWTLLSQGRTREALDAADEAIRLNPKNPEAYNTKGTVNAQIGEYGLAIADFNRVLAINPKLVAAYNNRGLCHQKMRDYPHAISDYDSALQFASGQTQIIYNSRGTAYLAMGDYARAMADFSRAVEIDPKYAVAYNNRGNAYCGMKDYAHALEDYTQAIGLNGRLVEAYNNRGNIYQGMKDYHRAIMDYNRALEVDAEFALAYNGRGNVYRKTKDYSRAIADYSRAVELDPKYALAYFNRAAVFLEMGEYRHAMEDYNRGLAIKPDVVAYHNRGILHYKMKNYDRSIADFQSALKLEPNNQQIKNNLQIAMEAKARQR